MSPDTIAVNGSFLVQPLTGVQRYARELIKAFRELGVENLVVLAPSGYLEKEYLGYRVVRDSLPWPRYLWLWEQVRLPWLMRKSTAKILWSPCNTGPVLVRRQVVTIHDASVFASPSWFSLSRRIVYRLLLPTLGRAAVKVLTPSEFSRHELVNHRVAPEQKISVIPLGIGTEFRPTHDLIAENSAANGRFVLCVGSRDPRKNVARLIQAWGLVDGDKKVGAKLLVAGGTHRMFARETFKQIPEDVEFVGYLSDDELISLYRKADFFVYPSLYEGFGLPPLEAMASGTPVIASNAAPLPEVVADAALLVDAYRVEEMANAIQRLLTDAALREELSRRGLKRAREFTWTRTAYFTWKVLNESYSVCREPRTAGKRDRNIKGAPYS